MTMDNKLDRIETKIDKLDSRIDNIDITLGKQHVTLEEHQRRSAANERAIDIIREELKPIAFHVKAVNISLKVSLTLLASSGFASLIKYLFF